MRQVTVVLADGSRDTYEYGTPPIGRRSGDDAKIFGLCHTVTSAGALLVGSALPVLGAGTAQESFKYFRADVTYAPGQWVEVLGGNAIVLE